MLTWFIVLLVVNIILWLLVFFLYTQRLKKQEVQEIFKKQITLVEERNKYMVRQLVRLMKEYPGKKILAVVGAGHEKGMRELLLKVDVVR